MPIELKTVLNEVVKIVNFIKSRALQSRIFSAMCDEMGSLHKSLLLHTEVRWLSKGRVLTRFFELRSEIGIFLTDASHDHAKYLSNEDWILKLAYMADIFAKLNELNINLQGQSITVLTAHDKINAFVKKLDFWNGKIRLQNYDCFESFHSFIVENDVAPTSELINIVCLHLRSLKDNFMHYFPKEQNNTKYKWIRDPFTSEPDDCSLAESLIELSSDETLKMKFESCSLNNFWIYVRNEYSTLSDEALKVLFPFASSYLCEQGFSSLVFIKNKYRSKLNVSSSLRLMLTNIEPNIESIMRDKQPQPSH